MNKVGLHRLAALLFLCLTTVAGIWLLAQRQDFAARVTTDIFALLPRDERDIQAEAALASLAKQGERQMILLVSAKEQPQALAAAQSLRTALQSLPLKAQDQSLSLDAIRHFYQPARDRLLTPGDSALLRQLQPQYWFERALRGAYSPFPAGGTSWQDDPFGTFGAWMQALGEMTRVRPQAGFLMVESEGRQHVLLAYELTGSAFDESVQNQVVDGVETAVRAVSQPGIEVRRAGIVFHAAAASRTAQSEMSQIGLGGMLGTLLLVFLLFRGWRAPVLIVISLATGALLAAAVTFAVFPQVHALTLVFGASLVGVAVDYSIMVLTHSLDATDAPLARYRRLFPALSLAMLTTVLAYLGLMLTPFPALAQMAVFSAVGIISAWLSVLLWFPWCAPASLAAGPLARWYLHCTPRVWSPWLQWGGLGVLLVGCLLGLTRLQVKDDVRALSGVRTDLLQQQIGIGRILDLPSPAQMFLVSGAQGEEVLQREEALRNALLPWIKGGKLAGIESVSRWVPSAALQTEHQTLLADLQQRGVTAQVQEAVDFQAPVLSSAPLTVQDWLQAPVSKPFRHLWLGQMPDGSYASVVLLKGMTSSDVAAELARLQLPGVRWVDKPAEISQILSRYRNLLVVILSVAYAVTALALWARYRRDWWRALLPPAGASILVLGLMGWAGQPLQLLSMVSLMLILGMGVDYGIFLLESPTDRRGRLATLLAAMTALLSFGLLAFSTTPVLHAFGFSMLGGIAFAWLLALRCRRRMA